jgi:hypothetical protein
MTVGHVLLVAAVVAGAFANLGGTHGSRCSATT